MTGNSRRSFSCAAAGSNRLDRYECRPKSENAWEEPPESRRNAMRTREPGSREFWREMESKWLELADSYQHAARTEALLHEMRRLASHRRAPPRPRRSQALARKAL